MKVEIVPANPEWPAMFQRERAIIQEALGATAVEVHHTGSTSVPGLAAKPLIDITLVVPNSADAKTDVIQEIKRRAGL